MTTIHTNIRSILTNSGLSALKINSAYPARFSRQGAVYSLPLRYPARFSRQGGDTINLISPLLQECIKLPQTFSKGFNIFKIFLILSTFGPMIKWLIRTFLGLLFSAIGIVWNESSSALGFLYELSKSFLDY